MAQRSTMNVSVTPEIEGFIQALVASGRYNSASEVFREGIRLLEQAEQQRLLERWLLGELKDDEQARIPADLLERAKAHVRAKVQQGLEAARRGDLIDGEQVFRDLRDRRREHRGGAA
jgi:antitoxin ParD1/3/4